MSCSLSLVFILKGIIIRLIYLQSLAFSKLALDTQDIEKNLIVDITLLCGVRRAKEPLDESEKAGLKLNIQKTKIMASGPITSWQIDGETMETMTDFIFWAPKSLQMVTAAMKLKDICPLEEKL